MKKITRSQCAFRVALRELWEDHVNWTRNVIFCLVDNLPGTDQALSRLMKNQEDLGGSIKRFFGKEAAKHLTDLLKEHISIAGEVIAAAKAKNDDAYKSANERWVHNADEIAIFLNHALPKLRKAGIKEMMRVHLKLTANEALMRINKDYDTDISATDKVHMEIRMMSDMLCDAIIKQFPKKFK
jgi:hypothetical protein